MKIELCGGVHASDLPRSIEKTPLASSVSNALWPLTGGGRATLEYMRQQTQPRYDLAGLIHPNLRRDIPAGHFTGVDSYAPRAFSTACVTNAVLTRHAKAIGAAGYGLIEEFNVSGSAGVPDDLLRSDLVGLDPDRLEANASAVESVPGRSVPIGHYGFETFGHFVLDALLQVHLFEDELKSGSAKLVHWPLADPWMDDLLSRCGAPASRRRLLSKPIALLQRASLSSALAGHGVYFPGDYSVGFFNWLREKLIAAPGVADRIYIRRPHTYMRRIINQPAVEEFLANKGFTIITPENSNIVAQANAFAGAQLVVGAWGSGLTLSPLLAGRRVVIELLPTSVTDPWFLRQAAVHGLSYYPLIHKSNADGDFAVNLDQLAETLALQNNGRSA